MPVSKTISKQLENASWIRRMKEFFLARRNRADREAFRRILNREGGEPPRSEDEWIKG